MSGPSIRPGIRRAAGPRAALVAAGLMLAGCGSDGAGPLGDLAGLVAASVRGAPDVPTEAALPPPGPIAPGVLDTSDQPMIALTLPEISRLIMTAAPDAGDYLNFQDQNRRGIRMLGGAVAGTYGFGVDLLAVRHGVDDPIARPTPLADWPAQVDRDYQYRLRDLDNYSITVACVFDVVVSETIEVIEAHDTVRVAETCTNQARSFTNTYWVEPATGTIRRSAQWTGPTIRPVTVELLRPTASG